MKLSELHTTCASCKVEYCELGDKENCPKNCPMRCEEYMDTILDRYMDEETHKFYQATKMCTGTEDEMRWTPRLRNFINLAKYMGYKKIGIAFCGYCFNEAKDFSDILRHEGIEVVSAMCLNGGINITKHEVPLPPYAEECGFDPACNPIGQARLMNAQKTDFNIIMGLCAGHDSLFMKYSEAMCTVFALKDPAMLDMPLNALRLMKNYPHIFTDPSPRERREAEEKGENK